MSLFLKFFSESFLFSLLLLFSSALQLAAPTPTPALTTKPKPPPITCKSVFYPPLCRAMHAAFKSNPSDPYHTDKFTVQNCLNKTLELHQSIKHYLSIADQDKDEYYGMLICIDMSTACKFSLEDINKKLEKEEKVSDDLVDYVKSQLSSVVDYQQNCYKTLKRDQSLYVKALSKPTGNMTLLYSVSVEVVKHVVERNLRHKNQTDLAKPNGPPVQIETIKNKIRS